MAHLTLYVPVGTQSSFLIRSQRARACFQQPARFESVGGISRMAMIRAHVSKCAVLSTQHSSSIRFLLFFHRGAIAPRTPHPAHLTVHIWTFFQKYKVRTVHILIF